MQESSGTIRLGTALWRGLFLANSWTWCIGMWLPVYLVIDFGWPGWVAFLVPNVVGAAAMGVLLRRRGASEVLVERHGRAMRAFSVFTVMFHIAFLAWLVPTVLGRGPQREPLFIGGAAVVLLLGAALSRCGTRGWAALSVIVFLVGVASAVAAGLTGPALQWPPEQGTQPPMGLVYLLPVVLFGFGLCPYLDLTFHRTRREAPGATGTAAFVLGFGVFFTALMVFSLLYAGGLARYRWFNYYVLAHIGAQSAFTVGAHLREVFGRLDCRRILKSPAEVARVLAIVLSLGGGVVAFLPEYEPGISAMRVAYMLFLGAYATVFPAYVWTVMIERGLPRRMCVIAWLVSCAVAAPMLWAAFVERRWVWLVPAVGAMLVAPLIPRLALRAASRL